MTKTFITTKGEYLLVEVPEKAMPHVWPKIMSIDKHGDYSIISLLKDITEEQAKEIMFNDPEPQCACYLDGLKLLLQIMGIDTSLNWLLLKKL